MRLGKYLKTAFINRWNLLLFLAGMGFALLSGRFDVAGPLVLATELAYLGLIGTHPRFQAYVEAQEAKIDRQGRQLAVDTHQVVQQILRSLPKASVQRFESLRARCAELRQLAIEMRDPQQLGDPPPLEALQLAGLDRLLWIYLRLLFTQYSLDQFLQKTDEQRIQADIRAIEARLAALADKGDDTQRQRFKAVLQDNLDTSRTRLANVQKARQNCELVLLQLDSLENKIRSLSELAINRHEPDFISGQVDQVVSSMVQTEQTMTELQFITGLDTAEDHVPEMLRRPVTTASH
ncbi:MAG: hypothetical protein GXY55_08695 [Phycisphaerae bacterium]|nr:hypothetical protein [Phycisphaerae bacterium]